MRVIPCRSVQADAGATTTRAPRTSAGYALSFGSCHRRSAAAARKRAPQNPHKSGF
jgi:hypothetical protein